MNKLIQIFLIFIVIFSTSNSNCLGYDKDLESILDAKFQEAVNKSNYCRNDEDCYLAVIPCHLGCWSSWNKKETDKMLLLIKRSKNIFKEDGQEIICDCPIFMDIYCRKGKCTIE